MSVHIGQKHEQLVNPALLAHARERQQSFENRVADRITAFGGAKRQALANQQWATVQEEDRQNEQLLRMAREILELAKSVDVAEQRPRGG